MIRYGKPTEINLLIPVYNSERYIRRCIDNVLRQTCKSSNGSAPLMSSFTGGIPEYVVHV